MSSSQKSRERDKGAGGVHGASLDPVTGEVSDVVALGQRAEGRVDGRL